MAICQNSSYGVNDRIIVSNNLLWQISIAIKKFSSIEVILMQSYDKKNASTSSNKSFYINQPLGNKVSASGDEGGKQIRV